MIPIDFYMVWHICQHISSSSRENGNPCELISFQVAVVRQLCKSVDVYDHDIHLRSFRT
jgi:hypothetical protein